MINSLKTDRPVMKIRTENRLSLNPGADVRAVRIYGYAFLVGRDAAQPGHTASLPVFPSASAGSVYAVLAPAGAVPPVPRHPSAQLRFVLCETLLAGDGRRSAPAGLYRGTGIICPLVAVSATGYGSVVYCLPGAAVDLRSDGRGTTN